jgi:hemolysin III
LAGGLVYSAGVVFHVARDRRYQNAAWHACVLVAACIHYAAVLTLVA